MGKNFSVLQELIKVTTGKNWDQEINKTQFVPRNELKIGIHTHGWPELLLSYKKMFKVIGLPSKNGCGIWPSMILVTMVDV